MYRRAFADVGTQALWNKRRLDNPTKEDALVIARALRIEGIVRHAAWRNRSNRPAVPLSRIQTEILKFTA